MAGREACPDCGREDLEPLTLAEMWELDDRK
jgi:hypothetical protein